MQLIPPRCPNRACVQHATPTPRFFVRHGYYKPRCRRRPVPRFRCRTCRRTFSRQTFRHDYRDRRPECNVRVFEELASGLGLRQVAKLLAINIHAVQRKFRKIARTCRWLHRNVCVQLPPNRTYVLDEEETYEQASIRPLTVPLLIDKDSYLVVASAVGPIRRLAAVGTARRRRQDRAEALTGPRRDRSRRCVAAVLRSLHRRVPAGRVQLRTDKKSSYAELAQQIFGPSLAHATTAGSLARTTFNDLFSINLTIAMSRDNCGRLRRQSWLVTKKRRCLQFQLHIFTAYRNYVRQRTNNDAAHESSAYFVGLMPRALQVRELLRWRQDWGPRSIHPLSRSAMRTVA